MTCKGKQCGSASRPGTQCHSTITACSRAASCAPCACGAPRPPSQSLRAREDRPAEREPDRSAAAAGWGCQSSAARRAKPLTVKDVDGSGWFYSGEPAYALSIGGVGNLSACAEWEHPCSTRRRSECLAWDAEDYEVEEQIDLFMSEFLDVADGVTGTRKTDVANAPSGYAYSP